MKQKIGQAIEQKVAAPIKRTEAQWREHWEKTWQQRVESHFDKFSDKLSEKLPKASIPKSKLVDKVKIGSDKGMSILNGLIGDYLADRQLSIAVQMAFYHHHQPLELNTQSLKQTLNDAHGKGISNKLCIMVHGLGCTERVWGMKFDSEQTYGSLLADDLGYTPLYVRYNTGLHISHNGQMLAELMAQLIENYPVEVEEVIFITHSMGGLVTRSACYYGSCNSGSYNEGRELQHDWTKKVRQLYFLGSPHLGADLEKFGSVVAKALKTSPMPYTQFLGELFDKRSAGIKDLRFGYVRDEDWQGQEHEPVLVNNKQTVPLLDGADHFVITGTVHKDSEHILSQFFGDALVRKYSATGQSDNQKHHLPFLPENQAEFTQLMHVRLAQSRRVYQQILQWVSDG